MRQQWNNAKETITSPESGFVQVARNPSGFLPYWLNMFLGVTIFAVTYSQISDELERELANAGLSLDLIRVSNTAGLVGGFVGAITGPWLSGFLLAGTVFILISVAGLPVNFRSLLILVGYSRLPLLIGKTSKVVIGLVLGSAGFERDIAIDASVMFPDTGPLLGALLTLVEPFYLWSVVLLVLGVAYLTGLRVRSLYWLGGTILALNWLVELGSILLSH